MSEKNICPGCGRHCDLNEPQCKRGEEYQRTGEMPEPHGKGHYHGMDTAHCHDTDMNDRLIINLWDLSHIMRSLYEGKASQKRILMILNRTGKITQRDLTERLGIQPGSASEILSKLENAGLILRTQNEADRRTTDVCLTDAGRELATEALTQRQKRHEEMFSCLSDEERQELLSLLEKVCADWKIRYRENRNVCAHGHGRWHGEGHDSHRHHHDHGDYDGHGHLHAHGHYEDYGGRNNHDGDGSHDSHHGQEGG